MSRVISINMIFCFKQKTAYDMLISDWSSDVCSSDLFIQQDVDELNAVVQALKHALATLPPDIAPVELNQRLANAVSGHHNAQYRIRSVERRVGKECVSTCSSRWSPYH